LSDISGSKKKGFTSTAQINIKAAAVDATERKQHASKK